VTGVSISMRAIAWVSCSRKEPIDDDWDSLVATIGLDADRFTPAALDDLDALSHVEGVYVFDRVDPDTVQSAPRHLRGNRQRPGVGIFAQRAKGRPNLGGVSGCRLLGIDGLTLGRAHAKRRCPGPADGWYDWRLHAADQGRREPLRYLTPTHGDQL